MKKTEQQLLMEKNIKSSILSKFPLLGVSLNSSKFISDNKVSTIETNGQNIIYNPDYISNLSFDEQVFEFTHNTMHIQFNHVARSVGKDPTTWNYATDAVINQILKSQGLKIINGGLDIESATNQSAEELYTTLIEERERELAKQNAKQNAKQKKGKIKKQKRIKNPRNNHSNMPFNPPFKMPNFLRSQGQQSQQQNQNNQSNSQQSQALPQNQPIPQQLPNSPQQNFTNNPYQEFPQSQPTPQDMGPEQFKTQNQSENYQNLSQKEFDKHIESDYESQYDDFGQQFEQFSQQYNQQQFDNHNQQSQQNTTNQEDEFHQGYDEEKYETSTIEAQQTYQEFLQNQNLPTFAQHCAWEENSVKLRRQQAIKNFFNRNNNEQEQYNEQVFIENNAMKKDGSAQQFMEYIEDKKGLKHKIKAIKKANNDKKNLKRLAQSSSIKELIADVKEGYEPIVDWKKYLKRNKEIKEEEKIEYTWSRRRATEDSHWQSRLERYKRLREEEVDEEKPVTLVVLDTSPSISDNLLRGFVNQLSELCEESTLFVGSFGESFHGFREVKPNKDGIIVTRLDRDYLGTNLDAACRAFKNYEKWHSEKKILNRIIFTDGDPHNGTRPYGDLRDLDCLWLIFDYPGHFRACCGRVLQFSSRDLMKDIRHEAKDRKNAPHKEEPNILT